MTFVSYAQNYEDVMLWRALGELDNGTYLDIGAQDPILHSVSRAFYDAGWRGVHVEPAPRYAAALRAHRPDEQVIEALVGNQGGIGTLFEIEDTGLSTGIDVIAERHRAGGWEAREIQAPVVTLADLLDLFKGRDIHWMKIDVEGMEPDVLQSWGDHPARPWIVAIESVAPMSQVPSHEAWLGEMLKRDYGEVYFDGLNRFFVAHDRPQIAEAFAAPPNVFDGFVVPDDHFTGVLLRQQRDEAMSAGEQAQETLREEAAAFEPALAEAHGQAEQARAELLAAQSHHASAEAELSAAHADREAQLGDQLREAAAALQAAADRRDDLHADFARRIEAAGAAHAERIDRMAAAQAGRDADAARRDADLSRLLDTAQDRHANAEADLRAAHAEREARLGDQLREAGAALQAAADQRAELQDEAARRLEALGAAHAEQIDRMAAAQAGRDADAARREADLSIALDVAHARIAAFDAQLGRAALLLRKIEVSRGWRWTAPLRFLDAPWRAPDLARQIASLTTELAGRAEAIALATAPAAPIAAMGENMDAASLQPPGPGIRATSLDELLALRDRVFVRSAYVTVLGREADPDGEAHHLHWLRRGVLKMQILGQLRRSPEGRVYNPGIAGLDRAIRRHRRRRIPLIGAILRAFGGGEGDTSVDRGFRALANEIGGLRDDQSIFLTQLIHMVDQRLLAPSLPAPALMPVPIAELEAISEQVIGMSIAAAPEGDQSLPAPCLRTPRYDARFTPRARNMFELLRSAVIKSSARS